MSIETRRLRLILWAPAHLLALIDGEEAFRRSFGLPAAPGLRGHIVSEEVSPAWIDALRTLPPADPWVHGFAVVERESCLVVGSVGFKGAPADDGSVEIGYGIVSAFQRRGYATEATEASVAFAFADERVRVVRAHTLPQPNASTRVLEKCGFARIGEVVDPEDGRVWRWERARGAID